MRKGKLKTGILFLLYTLLITVVFLGSILLFQWKMLEPNGPLPNGGIYYAIDPSVLYHLQENGFEMIGPGQFVDMYQVNDIYYKQIAQALVPLILFFCLFLLVTSIGFWFMIKRIQDKSTRQIAGTLRTIADEDVPWETEDDLEPAYASLKQRIDVSFADYKRLNAYLSHEQKNTISRIRTRMELDEKSAYLAELDILTAGIDDILTLSDSDGDASVSVDVTEVCAAVCDAYQKVTDNLIFDFDEKDEPIIAGKERWITRAVSNLVDNAVKYGEGRPIEVRVKCEHGSVIVTVKDNGPGISDKEQKKIFDHLYRVNTLNRNGYGIGLSLVAHVCNLCSGFVTVDSVRGKGSTFYLSFPQIKNFCTKGSIQETSGMLH